MRATAHPPAARAAVRLLACLALVCLALVLAAPPASAAPGGGRDDDRGSGDARGRGDDGGSGADRSSGEPARGNGRGPDDGRVGYDVSHPQCDEDLPEDPAFAVVGVNGGLATRPNPCLAEQLEWAAESATGRVSGQPEVQLYLNTANPGQVRHLVTTWPESGRSPYGRCLGGNTLACSWQYGWLRSYASVNSFFVPAATEADLDPDPAGYRWWLDVETMNTWQERSPEAAARNRAALEGMTDHLTGLGAEVGLYSTGYQWGRIAGQVPPDSPLYELDSWLAGATTRSEAAANCTLPPLVGGGRVVLAQYVTGGLDHNHPCR
ncbi:glycoside hydrolase family 25 domain-containing protein [Geodermatophilus marinus]|uniref:hypothetical protein n=1 Tax=Geodermatophilus sp. LHW52908 TaxID=2303986 RepID=UPI000E3D05B4|nr:hypothetical protein [Geodermatophilus sp. LHW52908]RFU18888.1 hypothetical protein D0Z06_24310 [Geodermatophilus sp. LHW52908]